MLVAYGFSLKSVASSMRGCKNTGQTRLGFNWGYKGEYNMSTFTLDKIIHCFNSITEPKLI